MTKEASDIPDSYRKYNYISLVQYTKELGALQEATATLQTTLDLEQLLGKTLDSATHTIPTFGKGIIHLFAPETGQLEIRAAFGYLESDPRIHIVTPSQSFSHIKDVVARRTPVFIPASSDNPDTLTLIAAPLIVDGNVLGVISLEANIKANFTLWYQELFANFALTATAAIRNAQLHAVVKKLDLTPEYPFAVCRPGNYNKSQHGRQ